MPSHEDLKLTKSTPLRGFFLFSSRLVHCMKAREKCEHTRKSVVESVNPAQARVD